jgi:hypothetical protein
METKEELSLRESLNKINEFGYTYIRVNYNGAGDSGDIDRPDFYKTKNEALVERIEDLDWKLHHEEQRKRHEQCSSYMKPIIKQIDSLLNGIEDWWNNDGGFGHIIINTENGDYAIENNINIVDQETYDHKGTIE